MSLRTDLSEWGALFPAARAEDFAKNVVADWIRGELTQSVRLAARPHVEGLVAKGSAGAGNWAAVPWVALFEPSVTTTATSGYYVVYLLSPDGTTLHLSLNQGTTAVREEFGSRGDQVLRERASFMRRRLPDFVNQLRDLEIDLGSEPGLPAAYVAGHAMGRTYAIANLPDDDELEADLKTAIDAYRALIFRGGLDLDAVEEGGERPDGGSVEERRQYRMHRKIERNPRSASLAKTHHGYICQACGFDYLARYGELGRNYIEAHHLRPISTLSEGGVVRYDVAKDFAVLCANCHRMIHRLPDPSKLDELRALISEPAFPTRPT